MEMHSFWKERGAKKNICNNFKKKKRNLLGSCKREAGVWNSFGFNPFQLGSNQLRSNILKHFVETSIRRRTFVLHHFEGGAHMSAGWVTWVSPHPLPSFPRISL